MAWYEDLTECNYFGDDIAQNLHAVGWLEIGKLFPTGEIASEVLQRLIEFRKNPWTSGFTRFRGSHFCNFCGTEKGMINLFIPASDFIYVCPELIIHYIKAHNYNPPKEFCESVLKCPPMDSVEYKKLLIKNGIETLFDEYWQAILKSEDYFS